MIIPRATNDTGFQIKDGLACSPASWTDVVLFFLSNYVTHVATVVTYPAEPLYSSLVSYVFAFLLPVTGVTRGLTSIVRAAKLGKNPLQVAARSGALYMVVRTDEWEPTSDHTYRDVLLTRSNEHHDKNILENGTDFYIENLTGEALRNIRQSPRRQAAGHVGSQAANPLGSTAANSSNASLHSTQSVKFTTEVYNPPWLQVSTKRWFAFYDNILQPKIDKRSVHGFYKLRKGFTLAPIPFEALVEAEDKADFAPCYVNPGLYEDGKAFPSNQTISASYNFPGTVAGIVQLIYGSITLAQTFGPDFDQHGYAAYGLTVVPYIIASLVNLIGNLLTPSYGALYMVASEVMDEATKQGCRFDGVVGRLVEIPLEKPKPSLAAAANTSTAEQNRICTWDSEKEMVTELDCYFPEVPARAKSPPEPSPGPQPQTGTPAANAATISATNAASIPAANVASTPAVSFSNDPTVNQQTSSVQPSTTSSGTVSTSTLSSSKETFQGVAFVPKSPNFRQRHTKSFAASDLLAPEPESDMFAVWVALRVSLLMWFAFVLVLAVYAGISRFQKAQSTHHQQVITMIWLVLGNYFGPVGAIIFGQILPYAFELDQLETGLKLVSWQMLPLLVVLAIIFAAFATPSILMFIQVAQMILAFGTCEALPG